jgi:hypothetical protein
MALHARLLELAPAAQSRPCGPGTIRRMIEPDRYAADLELPDRDERAVELSES